jgi:hypothetical protein
VLSIPFPCAVAAARWRLAPPPVGTGAEPWAISNFETVDLCGDKRGWAPELLFRHGSLRGAATVNAQVN